MIFVTFTRQLGVLLACNPALRALLSQDKSEPNRLIAATGALLRGILSDELATAPTFLIQSAHISQHDAGDLIRRGQFILPDGRESGMHSTVYLGWDFKHGTLTVPMGDIVEILSEAQLSGTEIVIACVTEAILTIGAFYVSEDFMEYVFVAERSREILRYVAPQNGVPSDEVELESCNQGGGLYFPGPKGERAYVMCAIHS